MSADMGDFGDSSIKAPAAAACAPDTIIEKALAGRRLRDVLLFLDSVYRGVGPQSLAGAGLGLSAKLCHPKGVPECKSAPAASFANLIRLTRSWTAPEHIGRMRLPTLHDRRRTCDGGDGRRVSVPRAAARLRRLPTYYHLLCRTTADVRAMVAPGDYFKVQSCCTPATPSKTLSVNCRRARNGGAGGRVPVPRAAARLRRLPGLFCRLCRRAARGAHRQSRCAIGFSQWTDCRCAIQVSQWTHCLPLDLVSSPSLTPSLRPPPVPPRRLEALAGKECAHCNFRWSST